MRSEGRGQGWRDEEQGGKDKVGVLDVKWE